MFSPLVGGEVRREEHGKTVGKRVPFKNPRQHDREQLQTQAVLARVAVDSELRAKNKAARRDRKRQQHVSVAASEVEEVRSQKTVSWGPLPVAGAGAGAGAGGADSEYFRDGFDMFSDYGSHSSDSDDDDNAYYGGDDAWFGNDEVEGVQTAVRRAWKNAMDSLASEQTGSAMQHIGQALETLYNFIAYFGTEIEGTVDAEDEGLQEETESRVVHCVRQVINLLPARVWCQTLQVREGARADTLLDTLLEILVLLAANDRMAVNMNDLEDAQDVVAEVLTWLLVLPDPGVGTKVLQILKCCHSLSMWTKLWQTAGFAAHLHIFIQRVFLAADPHLAFPCISASAEPASASASGADDLETAAPEPPFYNAVLTVQNVLEMLTCSLECIMVQPASPSLALVLAAPLQACIRTQRTSYAAGAMPVLELLLDSKDVEVDKIVHDTGACALAKMFVLHSPSADASDEFQQYVASALSLLAAMARRSRLNPEHEDEHEHEAEAEIGADPLTWVLAEGGLEALCAVAHCAWVDAALAVAIPEGQQLPRVLGIAADVLHILDEALSTRTGCAQLLGHPLGGPLLHCCINWACKKGVPGIVSCFLVTALDAVLQSWLPLALGDRLVPAATSLLAARAHFGINQKAKFQDFEFDVGTFYDDYFRESDIEMLTTKTSLVYNLMLETRAV
jgi:hypothetical protein